MVITQGRLDEIGRLLQSGQVKLPEFGVVALPDSPSTGLSSLGKVIDISSGQELGSISPYGTPTITGQRYSGTITGANLVPSVTPNYTTPDQTNYSSVTVPTVAANELSAPQRQESDFNKRIQDLNEIIAGRPAYETEQRAARGIQGREATEASLYNQLLGLKAQTENIPSILQAESIGRGRTAGGIEPIEIGRLRKAGIQANILNAQYSAARNDLANAERQLTQAVNDKFAPFEAERDAKLKNLQMVQSSPEYSEAQKQRAATAAAKIAADSAKKEAAKTAVSDILKLANIVAASSVQDVGNAVVLQQLSALTEGDKGLNLTQSDVFKALGIAQKYLAKTPDVTAVIGSIEEFKAVNGRLPKDTAELNKFTQTRSAAGRAPSVDGVVQKTILGGLVKEERAYVNTVQDNARQDENIKTFSSVRASYQTALSAAGRKNGAGDIVLMRMIAKITDPTTGVREEEFRTFEGAQSTLATYGIALTKKMYAGDRLTQFGREQLLDQANDIYSQRKEAYDASYNFFVNQLNEAGLEGKKFIPYFVAPGIEKSTGMLRSADGTQEVSLVDLTPIQIEEAKKAGWK